MIINIFIWITMCQSLFQALNICKLIQAAQQPCDTGNIVLFCFTDEETEAQRHYVTYPRAQI